MNTWLKSPSAAAALGTGGDKGFLVQDLCLIRDHLRSLPHHEPPKERQTPAIECDLFGTGSRLGMSCPLGPQPPFSSPELLGRSWISTPTSSCKERKDQEPKKRPLQTKNRCFQAVILKDRLQLGKIFPAVAKKDQI